MKDDLSNKLIHWLGMLEENDDNKEVNIQVAVLETIFKAILELNNEVEELRKTSNNTELK